ncbi:LptF/LptG family permease [Breznakiella homolactica]|uniref:LptF/LptG family permease n=1 Tax=Breznakiella homolactica TaxID=2798577 RepID=A0A7T7XS38_9SPIR|nr:LptF/LptG family permease [Breznakiella homolactica]QQO11409.1 LptF/LptG family permease [Breznakiella homolactica]
MERKRSLSWIICRYIVTEALFSFFVSFLFFFFIFFVNQLLLMAQEILTKRVPFNQVALLVLYSLPSIIAMAAPFAALVGTLMTVGRLSSDNEVLVMLSSGLSYANIFIPAFAVGILISLVSFFANDVLLPAGTVEFSKLYRRILVSTPALELESNSVKRFKETVLVTGNVNGTEIDDVLILDRTSDGERRIIMARGAELKDSGTASLSLDLTDAFIQSSKEISREDYDYASSSFLRYSVSQEDLLQAVSTIGPREMSSTDVRREIKAKRAALDERLEERYSRAIDYGLLLEKSLRLGADSGEWNRRRSHFENFTREAVNAQGLRRDRSLLIYRLEYYKKFSIPFGALCFIFLAVPLGLFARKSGQTVGFIFGLIIAVFYWALLLGGQTMGMRLGYSPFWSMWFPNILVISVGLVLCLIKVRQ